MKTEAFTQEVNLPELNDFLKTYSRYTTIAGGSGKWLFDSIMQPEVFIRASVISDIGLPAVLSVADESKTMANNTPDLSLDNFTKQFIGSVVCSLMEANGYVKTGRKRRVPHESFSVGECYVRSESGGDNG